MDLYYTPFPDYEIINKTILATSEDPTATPEVDIDIDMLYALNNISALLGTQWYLGLPFSYPVNVTGISELTGIFEQVLGDNLIALQLGNEPDLYGQQFRARPFDYWIPQYIGEWDEVIPAIQNNTQVTRQSILLAPSICCDISGNWSVTDLLDAGFMDDFGSNLAALSIQHYPNDNCAGDDPPNAQSIYYSYLQHSSQTGTVQQWLNNTAYAVSVDKPFMMFETNTASCAGFSGLSDSFAAALWAADWSMTLAYSNFSGALFHFGGQNAAYNAFTPPPSNYSSEYQWTTGPIYYANLMVAEALGSSNASQVVDLQLNSDNDYTVGYGIYENGVPARILLINFMDDLQTGSAAFTGSVHIGGVNGIADTTPSTVDVRYLSAPSVSEKFNITWAGQTLGGQFECDGRLQGTQTTTTVTCDSTNGCAITVPAPGAALIFLSSTAESESFDTALTQTFPTTFYSQGGPTTDMSVLETSNGRGGPQQALVPLGSTSHGEEDTSAAVRRSVAASFTLVCVAVGASLVGRLILRRA
ncbi:hypothetical protein DL93DRAFT_2073392 [Clavulina sp. PMI_390]|nr:hypothetical protein DL93DRAFT_2073392 [Clavulina sp. PMI_390]